MNRLKTMIVFLLLPFFYSAAQGVVGLKTNLLYGAVTFTPNLGVEIGLGKRTTLDLSAGYNPWNADGESKIAHFIVQPELRYFLNERFNGHFFGVHALYSQYNIKGHSHPMLFGKGSRDYRYEGNALGAGVSYGYQLLLGTHWNLEFELGAGYARLDYGKYNCGKCGTKIATVHKNYFGPTKAGVSLIYIIQ
ncbi:MAG: DUF3575 domain-containing protein [Bacteroides sp.]